MDAKSNMILDINDCWEYLRSTTIGCLAVIGPDGPDIFPVNYAVEHSAIVFRSGEGTKVDAIREHPATAFEVDGYEPETDTAWSVVLKGQAKVINDPDELRETVALDVFPWQPGAKNRFIRITAEDVSGRRFPVTDSAAWETPLSHVARAPRE
ncbi:pyridoxamine 5'-phosphate oxidase family protein [Brevibacterium sp. CBA3109]|uniref:Pyridoxamine 5'-phosphate oxidase family protein n=1 Tax=Brevibacterium koreense TaxID=3140787 RepID=A0AAU7UN93_9MICO